MTAPTQRSQKDAQRGRADGFARKQQWKELPGNRYTPDELRKMSESLGPLTITEPEPHEMRLD